jgi:hypothetical protein
MEDNPAFATLGPGHPIGSTGQLVPVSESELVPTMVSDIASAKARLRELQEFVREVMVEGEDYGTIPGTEKPALYKPGAEKLCEIYGLIQCPTVVNRIEDWDAPHFHYEVRCDLVSKRTGRIIGSGFGSCNSYESRYRWRMAERTCPICHRETIIRGKEEYGGGWLCFRKKGGCGAKFQDGEPEILNQMVGRVPNEDVCTLVNTLLKMAKKRALVDAVLSVTRSSGLFTQDVEDLGDTPASDDRPRTDPPSAAAKPGPLMRTMTDAQRTILLRKAQAAGISPQAVADFVGRSFGAASIDDLPFEQVNYVLKWIAESRQPGDE